ncbi:MAG TPA: hypothetical protein VHG72_08235 [Polyangia bacterium]|nr:hypothetical protein [Polyangia bacterium]
MSAAAITFCALVVAFLAARAALRRRGVLLLGRSGRQLAPAVLASLWIGGLLIGEVTGSVAGMAVAGALVLLAVALISRRRFARLKLRRSLWTGLDWALFLFIAVVFWAVDLWDLGTREVIVVQYLHGNIPPAAINDPRFPLAYHSLYDALTAVVLTAAPIDLQTALAIVSTACVALTLTNLQAVTRSLFSRLPVAQLGRGLFMLGFGPVFIRCAARGWDPTEMHGQTAQAYVDLILRRPAGLGFALFTLALALILPCYGASDAAGPARRRAVGRLVWLVPTLVLLPQMAEEAVPFLLVFLAPLALARRLSAQMIGLLVLAALVGVARSGVFLGVFGHHAMATPAMHFGWPPRLPTWAVEQTGVSLLSRRASAFYWLELGPVFLTALVVALAGRDGRRRVLGLAFLVGLAVAVFADGGSWKKSDMDRFIFYGTPPVFMLAADLPDRIWRALRGSGARPVPAAVLATFGLVICGPTVVYPGWQARVRLEEGFRAHTLGGDLRRTLRAAGPRQPILTTVERANALVMAGFSVIAPLDTNAVGEVTIEHFDSYVRANAGRAVWLFLPAGDPRVAGRRVLGRDGGYVLVPGPAAPATIEANSR